MLNEQQTRDELLKIWGEQACIRSADWPEVLAALMKGRAPDERDLDERGNLKPNVRYPKAGLRRLVDDTARTLTAAFADQIPTNPAYVVWRAFPRLDRTNCARLAMRLIEIAGVNPDYRGETVMSTETHKTKYTRLITAIAAGDAATAAAALDEMNNLSAAEFAAMMEELEPGWIEAGDHDVRMPTRCSQCNAVVWCSDIEDFRCPVCDHDSGSYDPTIKRQRPSHYITAGERPPPTRH
jgi:hypothetical protein